MKVDFLTVVQGSDRTLTCQVMQGDDPLDLTGATEIEARFAALDSSGNPIVVSKKLSLTQVAVVSPAQLGKVTITLTAADTLTLVPADRQDFSIAVTNAGKVTVANFSQALTVRAKANP